TLEFNISPIDQIKNAFSALKSYNFQLVITAPNIEVDRTQIIAYLQQETSQNRSYHYIESLGVVQYHSLIPYCKFVIGNSSSGILEIPYFKIPTVNIGDRQQGRIRHKSIIDTDYSVESISSGIAKALSSDFLKSIQDMKYKFGTGNAAKKMVEIIRNIKMDSKLLRKQLDFPENEE
ncbi:MAG: UDP-N-acetylglucosamine 2-epimerase, partial [bacterium]